jgi:hypothetical protein
VTDWALPVAVEFVKNDKKRKLEEAEENNIEWVLSQARRHDSEKAESLATLYSKSAQLKGRLERYSAWARADLEEKLGVLEKRYQLVMRAFSKEVDNYASEYETVQAKGERGIELAKRSMDGNEDALFKFSGWLKKNHKVLENDFVITKPVVPTFEVRYDGLSYFSTGEKEVLIDMGVTTAHLVYPTKTFDTRTYFPLAEDPEDICSFASGPVGIFVMIHKPTKKCVIIDKGEIISIDFSWIQFSVEMVSFRDGRIFEITGNDFYTEFYLQNGVPVFLTEMGVRPLSSRCKATLDNYSHRVFLKHDPKVKEPKYSLWSNILTSSKSWSVPMIGFEYVHGRRPDDKIYYYVQDDIIRIKTGNGSFEAPAEPDRFYISSYTINDNQVFVGAGPKDLCVYIFADGALKHHSTYSYPPFVPLDTRVTRAYFLPSHETLVIHKGFFVLIY